MNSAILKAIRDWSIGKFQPKGNYLTEVPKEYITTSDLQNSYLGGIKLGKDENGNPGYFKYDEEAGADTLVPFSVGGGGDIKEIDIIYSSYNESSSSTSSMGIYFSRAANTEKEYKMLLAVCEYYCSTTVKNVPTDMLITDQNKIAEVLMQGMGKKWGSSMAGYLLLGKTEQDKPLRFYARTGLDSPSTDKKTMSFILIGLN